MNNSESDSSYVTVAAAFRGDDPAFEEVLGQFLARHPRSGERRELLQILEPYPAWQKASEVLVGRTPPDFAALALEALLTRTTLLDPAAYAPIAQIVAERASELAPYIDVRSEDFSSIHSEAGALRALLYTALRVQGLIAPAQGSESLQESSSRIVRMVAERFAQGKTRADAGIAVFWELSPLLKSCLQREDLLPFWDATSGSGSQTAKEERGRAALLLWACPAAGGDRRILDLREVKGAIENTRHHVSTIVLAIQYGAGRLLVLLGQNGFSGLLDKMSAVERVSILAQAGGQIAEASGEVELKRLWLRTLDELLVVKKAHAGLTSDGRLQLAFEETLRYGALEQLLGELSARPLPKGFGVSKLQASELNRDAMAQHPRSQVRAWLILHHDDLDWVGPEELEEFARSHRTEQARRARLSPGQEPALIRQQWG